jgi:thiamine pyrophosphokinase
MNQTKTVAVVGNGTLFISCIPEIKKSDMVIGVDRAAYWLLSQGITPDVAIGDFDSVTPEEFVAIKQKVKKVESFSPEKDYTDMELALDYAAKLHPAEITIFGGVGNRLDHSIGNVLLLNRYVDTPFSIRLVDETNECRVTRTNITIPKSPQYRYVSVLSLTDESTVTLTGFVYDIRNYVIKRGQTIGISNEIKKEQGSITVHNGVILVIQSRD